MIGSTDEGCREVCYEIDSLQERRAVVRCK